MEEPLGEFEGQNVVVLEVEEEVFETERRENWAQRVKLFPVGVDDVTVSDIDEVQILASRFGKGSVRYRKQFSVGCLVYQSAESTISHSSPSSTLSWVIAEPEFLNFTFSLPFTFIPLHVVKITFL